MKHLITLGAILSLSACATTTPAAKAHAPTFGQAVKHNMAAQAVAPTPEQKANTFIPADPAKRAKARENYRTGETPDPVPIRTNGR